MLPIALGATKEEYLQVSPENSFIHVSDFDSPKQLAYFLHKLDKDDDAYNEFFRWKGTGEFIPTSTWCRICAMLHDPNPRRKVYENVTSWWKNDACRDPQFQI